MIGHECNYRVVPGCKNGMLTLIINQQSMLQFVPNESTETAVVSPPPLMAFGQCKRRRKKKDYKND